MYAQQGVRYVRVAVVQLVEMGDLMHSVVRRPNYCHCRQGKYATHHILLNWHPVTAICFYTFKE